MTNVEYQQKMTERLIDEVENKEYMKKLAEDVKEITGYNYDENDYINMIEDLIGSYYQTKEDLEEELKNEIRYREDNFRQLTPGEMGWYNETC